MVMVRVRGRVMIMVMVMVMVRVSVNHAHNGPATRHRRSWPCLAMQFSDQNRSFAKTSAGHTEGVLTNNRRFRRRICCTTR